MRVKYFAMIQLSTQNNENALRDKGFNKGYFYGNFFTKAN